MRNVQIYGLRYITSGYLTGSYGSVGYLKLISTTAQVDKHARDLAARLRQLLKTRSLTCLGYVTGTFLAHGAALTYEEMHPFSKPKNKLPQPANREH